MSEWAGKSDIFLTYYKFGVILVIAVLVIDEEEDTYNTALAKSRAPYRTTTEHECFTDNYK